MSVPKPDSKFLVSGATMLSMPRLPAVLFAVLVVSCAAEPTAAPSASRSPSPPVATASSSPTTPATTSAPPPTAVRTPIPLPNAAQIDAPSASVLWVLVGEQSAGARLFRSTDRGETWRESAVPPIAPAVISFIDDREGWAMVPRIGVPPPVNGQCGSPTNLSHTNDGGTTWQEIITTGMPAPGPCKNSIRFADAQHGFISAYDPAGSPLVYRGADGGRSWIASARLPDPPGFTTRGATGPFLNAAKLGTFGATIFVTVAQNEPFTGTIYVYRSTDGGATWTYASTAPNNTQDVVFVTATRWLQIASPGDAKETTDGGATWHAFVTQYQQAAPVAPSIVFGDAQVGYATVRGQIQRTTDGGAHWSPLRTPGT